MVLQLLLNLTLNNLGNMLFYLMKVHGRVKVNEVSIWFIHFKNI